MGINSRRRDIPPPLPAPTETDDDGASALETDVATNVTTRTDKSSFEIPADGSPITIPTHKIASKKEGRISKDNGQTSASLLIEYFEGSATGDKTKSRPTVRVKVSQGSKKRSGSGAHDAVQITGIGSDRKPSYTRRISLGNHKNVEIGQHIPQGGEHDSSESTLSNKPPIEIEVLGHNASDVSTVSRGLLFNPVESNVSSMPADSMIEGRDSGRTRSFDRDDYVKSKSTGYLQEPERDRTRTRSTERIAQKVMEKLNRPPQAPLRSGKSRSERSLGKSYESEAYPPRSDVSNNPKLLGLVQDTIRNIILPEVQAAKHDQRYSGSPRSAGSSRRSSYQDDGHARRVSKSSSSPNISSKPKIYLNRDGDEPGAVLSRGDSERRTRKSSGGSYSEDRPTSRRSSSFLRNAGAASIGAGILTAAALEMHDKGDSSERRRKRRSKSGGSRSRSDGATESGRHTSSPREEIPPLPLAGGIPSSGERTRESLVSSDRTKNASSWESVDRRTPVRGAAERSLSDTRSPPLSSRTPTRTSRSDGLGGRHDTASIERSGDTGGRMDSAERMAALAAGGIAGVAAAKGLDDVYKSHVDADGYGNDSPSQRKISSPVQSISSLRKNFEGDEIASRDSRPRSAASRSSAGRSYEKRTSQASLHSTRSSPLAQPPNIVAGAQASPRSPSAPTRSEIMNEFQKGQDRLHDPTRQSYLSGSPVRDSFRATNRDSYQTNPYPQDEKRWTMFTDDSPAEPSAFSGERDLQNLGANPEYVHSPHGAESAVASLMDPSTLSSGSPTKATHSDKFAGHLREMSKDTPPMYHGSTVSQTMPSQDRWVKLKEHAQVRSGSNSKVDVGLIESPQQSPARSPERSYERNAGAGAGARDLQNARYSDTKSDVPTNPSVVEGPLGGDVTGKSTWPYTPDPASPAYRDGSSQDSQSLKKGRSKEEGMLAAAAVGSAAIVAGSAMRRATVEDEIEQGKTTPDVGRRGSLSGKQMTSLSPDSFADQRYPRNTLSRSVGSLTPEAEQKQYSKADVEDFNRAMDAQSLDERIDAFGADVKRDRHTSGNSHGMSSPLYDSAIGKGKDRIQSKDIVALMDLLTVRDAQRNARDTEILTTLIHSAAEMRQSFDEMKSFILEQDRMIMQNTDRSADTTAHKVLSGPRTLPTGSTGTVGALSQEEIQTKRKGVLRRALRGLTGGKSANDLVRVEGMLMQILDNVADLKQQTGPRAPAGSYTDDHVNLYERMRNAPDSSYDPEPAMSDPSTPQRPVSQPAYTPRVFHSGYDGRRGSEHRVSTVLEGDEDEYGPDERPPRQEYENTERLLTPTQEAYQQRDLAPVNTPPQRAVPTAYHQEDHTPTSADRRRKHQSNSSSVFGGAGAKISRWSKTTASSAPPDASYLDSPNTPPYRGLKAASEASRSGSTLARYNDEDYEVQDDDRLRSTQSLVREQEASPERRSLTSKASKLDRPPSPLIPSETSIREFDYEYARGKSPIHSPILESHLEYELDDPKYQAVRNSLLLQHPQPRQGATPRHQNALESQARTFDNTSRTGSDLSTRTTGSDFDPATWGSSGTAGLAKHRLSQVEGPLSPTAASDIPSPPAGAGYGSRISSKDQGPLIPSTVQSRAAPDPEDEMEWEPQYSNSGFSRSVPPSGSAGAVGPGGYYSSPWGSGHLLEPIEEVRYSLETDRDSGHVRLSPPTPFIPR